MEAFFTQITHLLEWFRNGAANESLKRLIGKVLNRLEQAKENHKKIKSYASDNQRDELQIAKDSAAKDQLLNGHETLHNDAANLVARQRRHIDELKRDLEKATAEKEAFYAELIVYRLQHTESERA